MKKEKIEEQNKKIGHHIVTVGVSVFVSLVTSGLIIALFFTK